MIDQPPGPSIGGTAEHGIDAGPPAPGIGDILPELVPRGDVTGIVVPAEVLVASLGRVLVFVLEAESVAELVEDCSLVIGGESVLVAAEVHRPLAWPAAVRVSRLADDGVGAVGPDQRIIAILVEGDADVGLGS